VNEEYLEGVLPLFLIANTPHWRKWSSSQLTLVKLLSQAAVNISARDSQSGETALHRACKAGNAPLVELLLSEGAEVNASGSVHRNLPLSCVNDGHIARLLIGYGAEFRKHHDLLRSLIVSYKAGVKRDEYILYLKEKGVRIEARKVLEGMEEQGYNHRVGPDGSLLQYGPHAPTA
jgi:ankyrin repeat protein